jgi:hypothetical protein
MNNQLFVVFLNRLFQLLKEKRQYDYVKAKRPSNPFFILKNATIVVATFLKKILQ